MFLLPNKIIKIFGLFISVLVLSSCASLGGGESRSDSSNEEAWKGVPKPYIDGLKAAQKSQLKQAVKLFKQSTEDYPAFSPAYTNLGLQQLRLKDYSAAKVSLQKSIELNSNNPVAFNHLGVIARLNGDFDTAKSMYSKAVAQNSDYAIAHYNLGILLDLYLYELEPALKHYEAYQSLIPKKDANVSKWIVDLKRRITKNKKS